MDLNEILVFAKVAETGSFSAAARKLDMPKSTVSRKIADLEQRLGARLIQRTTRRLSLTDAGRAYFEHGARIVAELEEADRAVGNLQDGPRGKLRVTAPLNFGFLGAIAAAYLARYPEVELELVCTDRVVNLVEEGFDVAIRARALGDSSLIARSLGQVGTLMVADPGYIERRGRPREPKELAKHDCVVFGAGGDRGKWKLRRKTSSVEITVTPRLVVNDFETVHEAVVAGLGIGLIPDFRCAGDLRDRRLERVLPEWSVADTPIHAVYPSTRHLSPKIRAFVEHLQKEMSPPPWQRRAARDAT
jgi:DNA-binding transcriptional LysR family regulator